MLIIVIIFRIIEAVLLVRWLAKLWFVLRQRGVGKWLLAPFRSWAGLDETRRPKP